jgi:hypothetical protein
MDEIAVPGNNEVANTVAAGRAAQEHFWIPNERVDLPDE